MHSLSRAQIVAAPLPRVFAFFAAAENLSALTPPWLDFRILTPLPIVMRAGAVIDYQIRLHGLPLRWRTLIEVWQPGVRFVDVQLRGPYRTWRHTHTFAATPAGTEVRDDVRYALPLGPVGRLLERVWVRRDLARIFDYRAARIPALLAEPSAGRR